MNDPLSYFSDISDEFISNYKTRRFQERKEVFSSLVSKYFPKRKESLLDLGCGPGLIAMDLASTGYQITGIDGSAMMIEHANRISSKSDAKNVKFIHLVVPDELHRLSNSRFNGIYSSSFIEYVDQPATIIGNLTEMLNNGGLIIISVPNKQSLYRKLEKIIFWMVQKPEYLKFVKKTYSERSFTGIMEEWGFKNLDTVYFGTRYQLTKWIHFLPRKRRCNLFAGVYEKR